MRAMGVVSPVRRRFRAAVDRREHRRQLRDLDDRLDAAPPLVVFQMGKVASATIFESLRRQYPGVVVHTHVFYRQHPDPVIARLARELHTGREYRFVSLVRMPIERNISDFFENYERYVGTAYERGPGRTTQELVRTFLERVPHDFPARWFDEQLRPSIGIDVYAQPFQPEGWQRYERGRRELLVMRAELADEDKARVVADFARIGALSLHRRNRGTEKRYGPAYRAFLAEARFPAAFIEQMCASRYFRTFYGAAARAETLRRWSAEALTAQDDS